MPLDVFLRITDSAMQPLVILHIPKTEELCAKMREVAETKTRKNGSRSKQGCGGHGNYESSTAAQGMDG